MIDDLTEEQQAVLDEYIKSVTNTTGIRTPSDFHYRRSYTSLYGEGEDIELLNENFYELIKKNNLTDCQIKKLAKIVAKRENNWFVSDNIKGIDPKLIFEDGYGYIVLVDGTRIDDIKAYMYRNEREKYNELRTVRLEKNKTNGLEYLEKE